MVSASSFETIRGILDFDEFKDIFNEKNMFAIKIHTHNPNHIITIKEGKEKLSNELKNIYFTSKSDTIVFPKNIEIVKYLENLDIEQEHVNIDAYVLLNALGIAKAKYNYEMEKRIGSYYRTYMDAIRDGKSDIDVMVKILSDDEVITFIDQNNNLGEYVSKLANKRKNNKEKVKIIGLPEVA